MQAGLNGRFHLLALGVCVFVCAVTPVRLKAQQDNEAAMVGGTVLDVAGKPIANAAVTAKNESTGFVRGAVTGPDGRFSVTGLSAGTYSIEASAPSFATTRRTGLKLVAGATKDMSLSLNIGELSQTVTVEGRFRWLQNTRLRRVRWRRGRQSQKSARSIFRTSRPRLRIIPSCSITRRAPSASIRTEWAWVTAKPTSEVLRMASTRCW
jgi:hypothetical protein